MVKYTKEDTIPNSIVRILNRHVVELNLNDIERCEEDMFSEKVIIPFSILFDMDMACIKLIQELYNKIPFWNDNISKSDDEIRHLLLDRKKENPLIILHSDESVINDLYDSLMKQNFGKILGIAMNYPTGLFDLIRLMSEDESTSITVYCDGYSPLSNNTTAGMSSDVRHITMSLQKTAMEKTFPDLKANYIDIPMRGCKAYSEYTTIFYKYAFELEKDYDYNSFSSDYTWSSKTILCADYSFNLDEKIPCSLRMDLVLRTGINNNIGLTNIYPNKEIQEG